MEVGQRPAPPQAKPILNMRLTLWGVQGSCPIFPAPEGVREYSRRVAVQTLAKAIEKMRAQSGGGAIRVEDLLGGEATMENIERFQADLGLPELRIFGGETTSLELETSEGNIILLDAGSGIRRCSFEIARRWENRPDKTIHLFGSHEHLDHRVGLTFARFLYLPTPYNVHIHGPQRFLFALDQHYGMLSRHTSTSTYLDDPVDYTMMTARFTAHEFVRAGEVASRPWETLELRPVRVGSTTITPFEVYHPVPMCLGYKIEHGGKTFVYATDHEMRRGTDPADPRQQRSDAAEMTLRQHCQGADLAYFDGQYLRDEYAGRRPIGALPPMPRMDWGHGCIEDIVERAQACGIARSYIGHHDPERSWADRVEMDQRLSSLCLGKGAQVHLADGDAVIDL